jgi:PII-like signaling protein
MLVAHPSFCYAKMIIEIVDSEEKIQSFLPMLGGMITMERVRALYYRGYTHQQ